MNNAQVVSGTDAFTHVTKTFIGARHSRIGKSLSSLLKVHTDVEALCKGVVPEDIQLTLHTHLGSFKEHYQIELEGHNVDIVVTSHNATDHVISKIRYPDTVKAVNDLARSMEQQINYNYRGKLQAFVLSVFRHNADTCVFQAESDQGEWHLALHDASHRTHVEIMIYASHAKTKPMELEPELAL